VSQINIWKKQVLAVLPEVFGRGQEREEAQHEAERDRLYQQIGKLQVEVDWLKKRTWTSRLTVAEKCRLPVRFFERFPELPSSGQPLASPSRLDGNRR
jgi:hypothetical protein